MKTFVKLAVIAATTLAGSAFAKFPEGQWTGNFWDVQSGKAIATDGNCFLADGTWYNTSATGVHGKWLLSGSEMYIQAVVDGSNQVYSSQVTVVNPKLMAGRHQHWTTDGSMAIFATTSLSYHSSTCLPPAN